MAFPQREVEEAAQRLIDSHAEATRRHEWTWFVDSLYTEDAVYTCEFAGVLKIVARGRKEIKATHYGEDYMGMGDWQGWSFPYDGYTVLGDQVTTHWYNRGPGTRADGSHIQSHGVSFLTYAGNGQFSVQYDLFDLAHQMNLCTELDEMGLLNANLKKNWVIPMKRKLIDALSRGLPAN